MSTHVQFLKDRITIADAQAIWPLGSKVQKIKGSEWHGTVVGHYSTALTPAGVCVESAFEKGSVQLYPCHAMQAWPQYNPETE